MVACARENQSQREPAYDRRLSRPLASASA